MGVKLIKDTTDRILGRRPQRCRICGKEGEMETYLVREMMKNTGEEFPYFVCDGCGCMQIETVPEDLGRYYGESYLSFEKVEFNGFSAPVKHRHKILDVGCGSGGWLMQTAEEGYGELYGCDPFLSADITYGDRIRIRKCSIHEMEGDHSFAFIRMGNSFEHVTDPEEVLKSAHRLLMKEGRLVMEIPVFPNIAFDMFGAYWFQIDAPRHITLHSEKSITMLAERTGFAVESIEYDSAESEIFVSFFYENGICYHDVNWDLIHEHFSEQEIRNIQDTVTQMNREGRGDHAAVTLVRSI